MKEKLKNYFPTIREKEELLLEIQENVILQDLYAQLSPELKEELLNFCTGMKGLKILRDSFFKEVINPEYDPERLESLLSVMLERKVKIVHILPNDSTRISDETSLLVTDIIVELEDGSLAKEFPNTFYHHARQVFDSGLKLDLLQEFVMIPLDIYHKRADNKPIESKLEAWLAFLTDDRPERILELITKYPEFKPMYETLYQMCLDVEKVMNMFFSEELRILDRNTVQYMIDEQQKELDEQQKIILNNMKELASQREQIKENIKELAEQKEKIASQKRQNDLLEEENARLKKELEELRKK